MDTSKITIKGPGIKVPIEITDPKILARFHVWIGPGTSSDENEGFIVNWGKLALPPDGLDRYEVSFYINTPNERLIYTVFYEYSPSIEEGFIYLPGKADGQYRLNVSTIYRRVEGSWYYASRDWENVAGPLIAKAKQTTSRR